MIAVPTLRSTPTLWLALLITTGLAWPALAQPPEVPARTTQWQLPEVRRVTPTGPDRRKQEPATLVSDADDQRLAIVTATGGELSIPFWQIVALHFEEDSRRVLFWHRSAFYLVVHVTDMAGRPTAAPLRLPAKSALATVDRLELDTGLKVDRGVAPESFRGIPVRATVGTKIVVVTWLGETIEGTLTHLTDTAMTVDLGAGQSRTFAEAIVRSIRLPYSPARDAVPAFLAGAATGAVVSGLLAASFGADGGSAAGAAALGGLAIGGAFALGAIVIGASTYPTDRAFDVYRARPPRPAGARVPPQLTATPRAVGITVSMTLGSRAPRQPPSIHQITR